MKTEKDFEEYLNTIRKYAEEEGYDSLDETYVEHLKCRFFTRKVIIGQSARIRLREMKMSDLDAFYGFAEGGEESVLNAFIKDSRKNSEAHLHAYIEHMYPFQDYGIWTVECVASGQVIGLCGLGQTEINGEICTDLGYYICPKCRKQGLALECIEIVLDYAKNYLEIPLIYAIIKEENRISADILRKFDFQYIKMYEKLDEKIIVYQKKLAE